MGVPSDIAHVMHPDGRTTPAMFVEVSADCKVHDRLTVKQCQLHCTRPTYGHLQVVLIVAQDLGMKPGKVGAQCAHAAVGLYKFTVAQKTPWLSAWEVGKTLVPYVLRVTAVYPTLCLPCTSAAGFDLLEHGHGRNEGCFCKILHHDRLLSSYG